MSIAPSTVVAVLGAGASGTLTAAHLSLEAAAAGRAIGILLVEPDQVGQGVAYATNDPRHRLNVVATGMSAFPDDPEHFLRWLRRHVDVDFAPSGFAARLHYREYLQSVLAECVRSAPGVQLETVKLRASHLRKHGRRLRLTLEDGTSRAVDAAVLAIGQGRPDTEWAPSELVHSPRFVADPWTVDATAAARGPVVFIGGGLTMADMAIRYGRDGVRMHAVSRHGLLPLMHAAPPLPPRAAPALELPESLSFAHARHLVFDHLRQIRAEGGDWRSGVDSLRSLTPTIWQHLTPAARSAFLAHGVRRWDRVRHRVAPSVGRWLAERVEDGSLQTHAASVVGAVDEADGLRLRLSNGRTLLAGAVINCTGPDADVRRADIPIAMNLLNTGLARPGSLGLGFECDADGRLIPDSGVSGAVWVIGPLRRGRLWETTAIPEIRQQAVETARSIIATLPVARIARRPRDPYGLPLSANAAAAGAYVEALGRILRVQSGAERLLAQAVQLDPDFALGHAAIALLGHEWSADVDVEGALAAAHRGADRADERELRFIEVVTDRVRNPGPRSGASLVAYVHDYPEDALAVSTAVPTITFAGATEVPTEAWSIVEGLAPAYGDDWWYRGLLAFIRQDQGRYDEAARLADLSLAVEPAAGHAVHARTHVYYETGQHQAGLTWLDQWIDDCGREASQRAHFSWHAAIHELATNDFPAAGRRYRDQLAPPAVSGVRALIDSASLLWRGQAMGAWGAEAAKEIVAGLPPDLLAAPPTPFVAMHAALALAAVEDCVGLARLRRYAASREDAVFTGTVAPLADALVALVLGDADRAAAQLQALTGVDRLGGSAAQREVIQDTLLLCARHARQPEVSRSILTERLGRRPSAWDAAELARATTTRDPDQAGESSR